MEKIMMLIDDDKDDRFLFSRAVKSINTGINSLTAEGGKEALEMLRDESQQLPNVIFLDINMPGMTGWEFLREVKQIDKLKHIPVIMYSTSSHERDVSMATHFGAIGYCMKTEDFHALEMILTFVAENLNEDLETAIKKNNSIKNFRHAEPFIT